MWTPVGVDGGNTSLGHLWVRNDDSARTAANHGFSRSFKNFSVCLGVWGRQVRDACSSSEYQTQRCRKSNCQGSGVGMWCGMGGVELHDWCCHLQPEIVFTLGYLVRKL